MNNNLSSIGRSYRFKKPVVIVLGAGSSVDLGYPTSRELSVEIISYLKKHLGIYTFPDVILPSKYDSFISSLSSKLTLTDDFLRHFLELFATSSEVTIDYFIRRNPDFQPLAVYLVGYHLLQYENKYALLDEQQPWQQAFFSRFFVNDRDVYNNSLNVITFNYDVSFEYFWMCRLKTMGLSNSEIEKYVLAQVKHIHGNRLLRPTEFNSYGRDIDDYRFEEIATAVNPIRLIERENNHRLPEDYWSDIGDQGLNVFFLGFGFDSENCSFLRLNKLLALHDPDKRPINIVASSCGLSAQDQGFIRSQIFQGNSAINFRGPKESIAEILSDDFYYKRSR